jgi:DNA-binding NarL/FixJ family response regulator
VTYRVSPIPNACSDWVVQDRYQPTVVLADDNPRIQGLVARILRDEFQIVASVGDGDKLIEAAGQFLPDVIVVDISMPGLSGIDAVKRLGLSPRIGKAPAIVFLTSYGDALLVGRALAAGGRGYVLKASAVEDLAPAIFAALRGETFVSASLN